MEAQACHPCTWEIKMGESKFKVICSNIRSLMQAWAKRNNIKLLLCHNNQMMMDQKSHMIRVTQRLLVLSVQKTLWTVLIFRPFRF